LINYKNSLHLNKSKVITVKKLTNKEEELLKVLWRLEKAFVKEIQAEFKSDTPHYNTLSTLVRNLEEKGYVTHKVYGNTHQYFPLVSKEQYRRRFVNTTLDDYFSSSYKNLVTAFAQEEKISVKELKEIIALIENQK